MAYRIRRPAGPHGSDELLESRALAAHRDVRGLEFLWHPALPQAGDGPADAQLIQGGEPARQDHRGVEQRIDDAGAEPDVIGDGGDEAEGLQWFEHRPVGHR